jgi:hypothetical protein
MIADGFATVRTGTISTATVHCAKKRQRIDRNTFAFNTRSFLDFISSLRSSKLPCIDQQPII